MGIFKESSGETGGGCGGYRQKESGFLLTDGCRFANLERQRAEWRVVSRD